jgi:putative acetyltransferase
MIELLMVKAGPLIDDIRKLILEYEDSLDFDLCFQDLQNELAALPAPYNPPGGCLLLARCDGEVAGCVAMQKLADGVSEMKRLYVKPKFRGRNVGRRLVTEIIDRASRCGYRSMRLDTLATMTEAVTLYRSVGFIAIEPYRYNPIEGALYMELTLDAGPGD